MNIYINEEKVEASVGEEKNLGEVFDQVSDWIHSQGHVLTGFLLNGKEIARNDLADVQINQEARLDFFSGKKQDIILESLQELDTYVDRVGNTIVNRDSLTEKEAMDLADGTLWMKELLDSVGSLLKLDYSHIYPSNPQQSVADTLVRLSKLSSTLEGTTEIESFLDSLREIKLFLLDLSNKLSSYSMDKTSVLEIIKLFSEKMDLLKDEFIRVNESYQAGKDAVATELLGHCTNRLSSLVTALMAVKNQAQEYGVEPEWFEKKEYLEMANSLNEMMNEAVQCMESGDIVQAGDIFEYELPELLDNFIPFLQELNGRIQPIL
ncbi:MAG: hypothetical protein AAF518_20920 [Spirochaetota bacterium]